MASSGAEAGAGPQDPLRKRSPRHDAEAASAQQLLKRVAMESEGKCVESANVYKPGGAIDCSLLSEEYSGDGCSGAGAHKRSSFLFATDVDRNMQESDPGWNTFWRSHEGTIFQIALIFLFMHIDAGTPILQDLYKKVYGLQHRWNHHIYLDVAAYTNKYDCAFYGCKWLEEHGRCEQKHSILYTSQTVIIAQHLCELALIYCLAFWDRGSVRDCINISKTTKFAPAGFCFGLQAVFGFLAMEEIGAHAYSLYGQTSIILVTLTWSLFFRVRLSSLVWISVLQIALALIGFNMADTTTSARGITLMALKIIHQCFACVYAEMFMKSEKEVLYIQLAWMKPVELLSGITMVFVMSFVVHKTDVIFVPHPEDPKVLPPVPMNATAVDAIAQLGFFHHWNWLTVFILLVNMGDTFLSAFLAKHFDSVVKGVAGVLDLIYPTQVFVFFINRPDYTPLMVMSGLSICLGALNFVLAKGGMRRSQARKDELLILKAELSKLKGYGAA